MVSGGMVEGLDLVPGLGGIGGGAILLGALAVIQSHDKTSSYILILIS